MKKYWKVTATLIITVLSFGIFYMNIAMSAEHLPELVIQTKTGDKEEIRDIVLEGSYTDISSNNYLSSRFKLTAEGSEYNNRSFLSEIIGQPATRIKELQEEYRSFMRGKIPSETFFTENSEFLAYARADYKIDSLRSSDFTFEVSVLNKSNNSTNSFTTQVPVSEELDHIYVEEVQMIDGELHIITQNSMRNGHDYTNENHIYTVDLKEQKISDHETILQVASGQDDIQVESHLVSRSASGAAEQLLLVRSEYKIIDDVESHRMEQLNKELISYNLVTKEKEEINLPDTLNLEENEIRFFDGSSVYFVNKEGHVTPYNLAEEQTGEAFDLQLSFDLDQPPMITVQDEKLYAVNVSNTAQSNPGIVVADVQTGDTLYEGEIVLKDDSSEAAGDFELYIYEIVVR
ncbi:hypothetical protein MM300_10920 [Evansella sp. LMS18]|uniref:hypothetical protein n=1 Tax=Evansella sp. LMS18 TaxID=2924033 RepID=UPI0020D188FC|nr:hypothetical protein [Evansella sp. LMS18]UTR12745.1 hypothetical protein MM300_10920 [Evansella sp. LMS18]